MLWPCSSTGLTRRPAKVMLKASLYRTLQMAKKKITCSRCGAKFDFPWQVAQHANKEHKVAIKRRHDKELALAARRPNKATAAQRFVTPRPAPVTSMENGDPYVQ